MSARHLLVAIAATLIVTVTAAAASAAPLASPQAVQYKIRHHFPVPSEGEYAVSGLTRGADGYYYGTTSRGGEGSCAGGCGTVFRIGSSGTLETVHSFPHWETGRYPLGGVYATDDGALIGTTSAGGKFDDGTIYRLKDGQHTLLHTFRYAYGKGAQPRTPPVPGADGAFYGVTAFGGKGEPNSCAEFGGCGTIYRMSADGVVTTMFAFDKDRGHGYRPMGGLTLAADGSFYGTASQGGAESVGTIFRWSPGGGYATVYTFAAGGRQGNFPFAGLTRASDGSLLGTTKFGGVFGGGTVYRLNLTSGSVSFLKNFGSGDEIQQPMAAVVEAADGALYGTASAGGGSEDCITGCGGVYVIKNGVTKLLHAFQGDTDDGAWPTSGLIMDAGGKLLGTTDRGGLYQSGTVFQIKRSSP